MRGHAPRSWPSAVGLVALCIAAAPVACLSASPEPRRNGDSRLVVTQVPVRADPVTALHAGSLDERYPGGSRIVLVDGTAADGEPRVLSPGLDAAGAPAVSTMGDAVLFAGRRSAESRWGIFEVGLDGGRPRLLVDVDADCGDPAYLADERIVFACAGGPEGAPDADGASRSLYVAAGAGGPAERITFGPGSAGYPAPLRDGRILFSLDRTGAANAGGLSAATLFTVNPDGTLLQSFAGAHGPPARRLRPRETGDGGVIFLAIDGSRSLPRLARVEASRPLQGTRNVALDPAVDAGTDGAGSGRAVFVPAAAEPADEGRILVTGRFEGTGAPATGSLGVYRRDADGTGLTPVFDDPGRDEVEAVAVRRRSPPRGRPSSVDRGGATGTLLCYNARRTDGEVGPPADGPSPTTVVIQGLEGGRGRGARGHRPPGTAGAEELGGVLDLGRAPVAEDGSFFLQVPADTPLRLRTLAADGRTIATSAWFWVRPGEVRACSGCHESRTAAPVNRLVEAISHPPTAVGESRGNP